VQSFRQIFAILSAEQQVEAVKSQEHDQAGEPMLLDSDLLSHVSGGASIPVGGW